MALIGMSVYIRRGFQGRLKQTADDLGGQYDPTRTSSDMRTQVSGHTLSNIYTITNTDNKLLTISNTIIFEDKERRYGGENVYEVGGG
jgi:hypothetical protein